MSLYIDTAGTIREIDAALVAAWQAAGNPKAGWLTLLPVRPSEAHQWGGSAWVLPPQPVPESISPRQARLWLLRNGIGPAQVDAVIASIPDAMTRQAVQIDWEYGLEVQRASPFVSQLGAAIGLGADALDAAFREAATL